MSNQSLAGRANVPNREVCFAFTVMRPDTEGGAKYTCRSAADDPGGPTKYGVTLATLRRYRNDPTLTADDVKALTEEEARAIFEQGYYDRINADLLPAPLALMAVDWVFNGGPAVRRLQERLGVKPDGVIGPHTAAVANSLSPDLMGAVISAYGAARLEYMQALRNWEANKNGWSTRVHVCMDEARKLINEEG